MLCVFEMGNAAITIKVSLNFGTRQKDCQAGFGLCFLRQDASPVGERQAEMRVSDDGAALEIRFSNALLEAFPEQFRDGVFRQETLFGLPQEVLLKLGIKYPLSIPAGNYQLSGPVGMKQISIPLRE